MHTGFEPCATSPRSSTGPWNHLVWPRNILRHRGAIIVGETSRAASSDHHKRRRPPRVEFRATLRHHGPWGWTARRIPQEPAKHEKPSRRVQEENINAHWKANNCDFCLWGHNHEECKKVKNVHERKQSLVTFGRCFNCIRKGHLSRDCKTNVICKLLFFKGKDRSCLCSADSLREGESQKIWVITVLESQLGITRMLKQVKASFYKLHKSK